MRKFWRRKPKANKNFDAAHSAGFVVFAGGMGGTASYHNNKNFAIDGYIKNDVVNRCLRMRAEAMSNIPIGIFKQGKTDTELADHPLLRLLRKAPNPGMSRELFFRRSVNNLAITGNLFYRWIRTGDSHELWIIPSTNVRVKMGRKGMVEYYEVTENNGNRKRYLVDQVTGKCEIIHIFHDNPINPIIGLSELAPIAVKIQQYNAIAEWNAAIMKNGGRMSGILSTNPDGDPNTTSSVKQKQELNEMLAQHIGYDNQGKVIITDSAVKFQELGVNTKDFDWIIGSNQIASAIAAGLGVPAQLVNIQGSQTYNNYALAQIAFHVNSVFPNYSLIVEQINFSLVRFVDESLYFKIDKDQVDSMNPARAAKWQATNASEFLTTNEKREEMGYGKYDDESADKILVSGTKTPIEDVTIDIETEPTPPPFGNDKDKEKENDDENGNDDDKGDDDENQDTKPKGKSKI